MPEWFRSVMVEILPYFYGVAGLIIGLALFGLLRWVTLWYLRINKIIEYLAGVDRRLMQLDRIEKRVGGILDILRSHPKLMNAVDDALKHPAWDKPGPPDPVDVVSIQIGHKPTLEGCGYDTAKYDAELIAWHERRRAADETTPPPD